MVYLSPLTCIFFCLACSVNRSRKTIRGSIDNKKLSHQREKNGVLLLLTGCITYLILPLLPLSLKVHHYSLCYVTSLGWKLKSKLFYILDNVRKSSNHPNFLCYFLIGEIFLVITTTEQKVMRNPELLHLSLEKYINENSSGDTCPGKIYLPDFLLCLQNRIWGLIHTGCFGASCSHRKMSYKSL